MSAAWRVDDQSADLNRLATLLGVICGLQFELAIGETDPRVDDLLWIAREMAEGLKEDSDRPNEQRTNGGAT